jgi:hypothetical protein
MKSSFLIRIFYSLALSLSISLYLCQCFQQSVCELKSKSFLTLTLRVNRSSSAAASVRIETLSGVINGSVPLAVRIDKLGAPGEPPPPPPLLALPGEPDFLCSSELKKFANTPSPLGAPGFNLTSI